MTQILAINQQVHVQAVSLDIMAQLVTQPALLIVTQTLATNQQEHAQVVIVVIMIPCVTLLARLTVMGMCVISGMPLALMAVQKDTQERFATVGEFKPCT